MNKARSLKNIRFIVQSGLAIVVLIYAYVLYNFFQMPSPGILILILIIGLLLWWGTKRYKKWNENIAFNIYVYETGLDVMPADEAVSYMENLVFDGEIDAKQRKLIVKYMLGVRGIKYTHPTQETLELNWPSDERWEKIFGMVLNQIVTSNWQRKDIEENQQREKPHEHLVEISSSALQNHSTALADMPESRHNKWAMEDDQSFYTVIFEKETERGKSVCFKSEQPNDPAAYEDPEDFDYAFSSLNFVLDTDRSRHTVFISVSGPQVSRSIEDKWIKAFETARIIPRKVPKKNVEFKPPF
ncbi:hypothetical protein SAMN05216436_103137 [bacterium A37T11]|nr:hypothetical protein SAMN05216436_103137 [bacterium A37T11]